MAFQRQASRHAIAKGRSARHHQAGSSAIAGSRQACHSARITGDDSGGAPGLSCRGIERRQNRACHIELRSGEPAGLYLFTPLILLQTVGTALIEVGFLETSILITPVGFAVRTMGDAHHVRLPLAAVLHG